ncbi:hypothetical protein NDN08_005424 [Rhodosorus marinus]|uniref:E2 ubiquitin-conjugating enzyme n=1 Tax=Rhodosorus marinus TaxID=101924 RepID=A0AAV8V1K8_9RHOD|nr:hypothetical protein NDN08_005424 [Rhodosorus marinus]
MVSSAFMARLKRELEMLETEPPPGVSVWPKGDAVDLLRAVIRGSMDTPYRDGFFHLEISVSSRYPFEPPRVRFLTPIYHPNIDSSGRICLNILNMPPKGGWKPALNLSTVLGSIQLLLSEPNPDDALMVEISEQFVRKRELFDKIARELTLSHAQNEVLPDSESMPTDQLKWKPGSPSSSKPQTQMEEDEDDDGYHGYSRKKRRVGLSESSSL